MEPVAELVGEGGVGPVACESKRGQVSVFSQLLLLFGERLLFAEQLQFRQVLVQSCQRCHVCLFDVCFLYRNGFVGRIVDDIFEHVILLCEHCLCVVILHAEILQVHVYTFHVDAECHVVVMEGLCDVAQFLQTFDVVFYYADLFLCVLCEIIHLADLHDEVFLGFVVRQGV